LVYSRCRLSGQLPRVFSLFTPLNLPFLFPFFFLLVHFQAEIELTFGFAAERRLRLPEGEV